MDFDFSEDQKMLGEHARRFLDQNLGYARLRTLADSGSPFDPAIWASVGELGWMATAVPEAHGGLGLGVLELSMLAEQLGRCAAPLPVIASAGIAAEAIRVGGSDALQSQWLPRLADGSAIGVHALPGSSVEARGDGSVVRLHGSAAPVAFGAQADLLIIRTNMEGAANLFAIDLKAEAVSIHALEPFDALYPVASICFDGAAATPLAGGVDAIDALLDRAAVLFAFEQIGGAQAALEMARDYVLTRYAFGRPIGANQAVKHTLADMMVGIELARANAAYAAWALDAGAPNRAEAAAAARLSATEAYDFASRQNLHLHGGIGFTWEADCHFHFRRARVHAAQLGGATLWADRLIAALERQHGN